MAATVYHQALAGRDDDFAHLYVVVIEIDQEQRLCIPAYGAEGEAVGKVVSALHRRGIFQGVGWVEMDNGQVITFVQGWSGKLAKWIPSKLERIEQRHLRRAVGTMSDAGLCRIVECLLNLHAQYPAATLAPEELPKVKRLARQLGVQLPPGL